MAGGVVHEQMLIGAQNALHAGKRRIVNWHELCVIEIDAGAVKCPQHAVGDVGGAGIGEEVAAAGLGHELVLLRFDGCPYRAILDVQTSVRGMAATIASRAGKSGLQFADYRGRALPLVTGMPTQVDRSSPSRPPDCRS